VRSLIEYSASSVSRSTLGCRVEYETYHPGGCGRPLIFKSIDHCLGLAGWSANYASPIEGFVHSQPSRGFSPNGIAPAYEPFTLLTSIVQNAEELGINAVSGLYISEDTHLLSCLYDFPHPSLSAHPRFSHNNTFPSLSGLDRQPTGASQANST
jgi:hypothetical protein